MAPKTNRLRRKSIMEIIMKGKKIALLLAGLTCTASFAACTDVNKKLSVKEYWKENALAGEQVDETLEYDVTLDTTNALSPSYKLSYTNGKYVTHLQSTPQGYEYTTKLTIDVTYQLTNSNPVLFTDSVETSVLFDRATLAPISSTKTVISHSPTNTVPTEIAHCYAEYHYKTATTYNSGTGNTVLTYYPIKESEKETSTPLSFTYGDSDYSYFDNEQLPLILRATDATASASIENFNPFMNAIQRVNISFAAEATSKFDYEWNGTQKVNTEIPYRAISMTLNDKNPGATQTAWIASTVNNGTNNTYRNVMLKMEVPLSYGYGTLIYTLKNVTTL